MVCFYLVVKRNCRVLLEPLIENGPVSGLVPGALYLVRRAKETAVAIRQGGATI